MLLLVLVPLVAIIPLAGVRVVEETKNIQAASDIRDQALIAERVSNLVNALADERDLTEAGLNGQGVRHNSDLRDAKRQTAQNVSAFRDAMRRYDDSVDALPPETRRLGAHANARLGDLGPLRDAVIRLDNGTPTHAAYSTIIDDLLQFSAQLSATSSDHRLSSLVSTLASVEQTEEQTSTERGYLFDILSTKHASLEQTEDLEQAVAQYNSSYDEVTNRAPTSVVNLYQSSVSGNRISRADGTVQAVTAAIQEDSPLDKIGVDASTTYGDMTSKLQAIRQVQQHVAGQVTARADTLVSDGRLTLYVNLGIIIVVVVLSYLGAVTLARSVVRPLRTLRTSALDIADNRLPEVVSRIDEAGDPAEIARSEPIAVTSRDEVGQVARAFDRVHFEAVRLATEQALLRNNVNTMFTNLSRRSESLVLRQLNLIDELENGEQNAAQLASLFKLDHLATRMRRNNESLLVLAGEEQGRRWNRPVLLLDVARAAIAEVEQYERVATEELPDVAVAGPAATDVVHLVAELIENATAFSAPETEVTVAASTLGSGEVMVEVTDAGIGMSPEELREINEKLAQPPVVDVSISRRMGLFVVGRLAAKHGIRVWLNRASTGGTSAVVVLPRELLKPTSDTDADSGSAFDAARRTGGDLDLSDILGPGYEAEFPELGRSPGSAPSAAGGPSAPDGGRTGGSSGFGTGSGSGTGSGMGFGSGSGTGGSGGGAPARSGGPVVSGPPLDVGTSDGGRPDIGTSDTGAGSAASRANTPPSPGGSLVGGSPAGGSPAGVAAGGGSPAGEEPPSDGFTWFSGEGAAASEPDDATGGLPRRSGPRSEVADARSRTEEPGGDFSWFEEQPGPRATPPEPAGGAPSAGASPDGTASGPATANGASAPVTSAGGTGTPSAGAGAGAAGSAPERLPIFEAIESEWFGQHTGGGTGHGTGEGAARGTGSGYGPGAAPGQQSPGGGPNQPVRSGSSWPPQGAPSPGTGESPGEETMSLSIAPAADQGARGASASGAAPAPGSAPASASGAAAASAPAVGGVTERGLPKRVPRSNLAPGAAAAQGAPRSEPSAVPPRSAQQLKERLARFQQGVRHGKGTADGGEGPPPAGGSDAR